MPSKGAEEVVQFCGGLPAILHAAGISVPPDSAANDSANDESAASITFGLHEYERVRSILGNERRLGLRLLERESSIPEATLLAFR